MLAVFAVVLITFGMYYRRPEIATAIQKANTNIAMGQAAPPGSQQPGPSPRRKTPSVLCMIMSMDTDMKRLQAVNSTWIRRCDKHLFIFGKKTRDIVDSHDVLRVDVVEVKQNLVGKHILAYTHVYKEYGDKFDWIFKGDVDSYVIMENMKHLLSLRDPKEPAFIGCHFKTFDGYMSGGAGFVISSGALRKLVEVGYKTPGCGGIMTGPMDHDDVHMGRCMKLIGVPIIRSVDVEGKESFHPQSIQDQMFPPPAKLKGDLPTLFYHPHYGHDCCSRYTISFHYVSPDQMHILEHLLYYTTVYDPERDGIKKELFVPEVVDTSKPDPEN